MIFFIPGIDETLRVNGLGSLTRDPRVLEPMAVDNKLPKLALLVQVNEAFVHCGKAPKRGSLWDPAVQVRDRGGLPSMGALLHAQADGDGHGLSCDTLVSMADHDYRNNAY
ncbi:MAG: hypothetical protein ACKVWR_02530 [Acidimicrobiales bacterium]